MMKERTHFTYEQFITLSGTELGNYVEPYLNDLSAPVPRDSLQQVLSEMSRYDESHLVYAIELGSVRSPETFAPHIPQYLSHELGSVRCAASRFLEHLPDANLSPEIVVSVRRALAGYADDLFSPSDMFADLPEKLQKRLRRRTERPSGS